MKEDKFGIIEPDTHKFNTIDSAMNYVNGLKGKLKKKAAMENFPITSALPEDRMKFLEYCISLMTKKNLPFYDIAKIERAKAVLWLTNKGYTYLAIATFLKKKGFSSANIQRVKDVEKEGIEMGMKAIERVKNTQTPILSGG